MPGTILDPPCSSTPPKDPQREGVVLSTSPFEMIDLRSLWRGIQKSQDPDPGSLAAANLTYSMVTSPCPSLSFPLALPAVPFTVKCHFVFLNDREQTLVCNHRAFCQWEGHPTSADVMARGGCLERSHDCHLPSNFLHSCTRCYQALPSSRKQRLFFPSQGSGLEAFACYYQHLGR